MATLTYDSTPADQPEFNEAEQEALQIGEQAAAEQSQMLAGKFKDAEALEQAYLELQSKLGEPRNEEPGEEVEEEGEEEEYEYEGDLTEEDVASLYNGVGGEERYNEMLVWAAENLNKDEIEMFDSVIETGDKAACFFAVKALNERYSEEIGSEKPLITGRGSRETRDVFRSQAEVIEAMRDPRYDKDPAYRNDVFEKLNRSDIAY